MTRPVRIAEINWTEYDRRVREEQPVVILPVGSLEQHGPHLPMNCDAVIPTALAERVAARTGDLVAPTFCYGYKSQPKSGGGNHFPGTTSLDGETLIRMTRDIVCEFARHGVRRMTVVDGHYENNMFLVEGIDLALRGLRRDGVHDMRIAKIPYWEYVSEETMQAAWPDGFPGWPLEHAGLMETSVMLHLHPALVDMTQAPDHPPADFPLYDIYPTDTSRVPWTGALSPSVAATVEKGERFVADYVDGMTDAIIEIFGSRRQRHRSRIGEGTSAMSEGFYEPVSGMDMPRFSAMPTFMRLPHVTDFSAVDIALVGVPWDNGTTNRAGARHGPREIRNMSSLMRRTHHTLGICPYELCRVADCGDASVNPIDLNDTIGRVERFFTALHEAGAVPLSAGGDHLVTLPVMRAIARDRPLGLIHFDAHSDTWDSYFGGFKITHGTLFRRAVEEGLLDPKRTIQIGIRGSVYDLHDMDFAHDSGMRVITIEEYFDLGWEKVVAEARAVVGDGPTYISFDVDGLDPVYAPGTGTPEIGGFSTYEAQRMLRGARGLNLVGGDVVEVAPPFDPSGNTALVGATMMFEILCVLAEAVAGRKKR